MSSDRYPLQLTLSSYAITKLTSSVYLKGSAGTKNDTPHDNKRAMKIPKMATLAARTDKAPLINSSAACASGAVASLSAVLCHGNGVNESLDTTAVDSCNRLLLVHNCTGIVATLQYQPQEKLQLGVGQKTRLPMTSHRYCVPLTSHRCCVPLMSNKY